MHFKTLVPAVALLVALTIMLYLFWWFNIPLGFQADYVYPRQMF